MTDNTKMREAIIKILNEYTQEMEHYGYYESNLGVSVDDYEDIADEIIAWQAAKSAAVPVVGEPVGFILLHENGGKNLTFHDNTGKLSDGWSQHKLVIHPTTPITAAELTTLHHLQ